MRLSKDEQAAGKRADFKVHYTRKGKRYFQVMWAGSATEAEAKFQGFARELGQKGITILRVEDIR
jgi:hypothetical protein